MLAHHTIMLYFVEHCFPEEDQGQIALFRGKVQHYQAIVDRCSPAQPPQAPRLRPRRMRPEVDDEERNIKPRKEGKESSEEEK
jgi:hypothetical protein